MMNCGPRRGCRHSRCHADVAKTSASCLRSSGLQRLGPERLGYGRPGAGGILMGTPPNHGRLRQCLGRPSRCVGFSRSIGCGRFSITASTPGQQRPGQRFVGFGPPSRPLRHSVGDAPACVARQCQRAGHVAQQQRHLHAQQVALDLVFGPEHRRRGHGRYLREHRLGHLGLPQGPGQARPFEPHAVGAPRRDLACRATAPHGPPRSRPARSAAWPER